MSGGVDSSVAAFLLKEKGYEIIGMSMHVFDQRACTPSRGGCCSPQDIHDARRIADQLKIPFYVINLEEKFKEEIIDTFASQYSSARTPNPCIPCNSRFKFHHLMHRAEAVEAAYVATGHYARIEASNGGYSLRKGTDKLKDQSYFLYCLSQKQLGRIIFPIGSITKSEVRKIAKKTGLRTHNKEESQEICFVTDGNYGDFIERHYADKIRAGGNFVDTDGNVIGKHRGIHRYTIGQRRGLGVSIGRPLYVIKINAPKNEVVLGEERDLYRSELEVGEVTWIKEPSSKIQRLRTKVRYKTPESDSSVELLNTGNVRVTFDKPVKSVTPGQAAVFYREDEVIGGGWIK